MRIYDYQNIPKVWSDYLAGHLMHPQPGMALIVGERTDDPELDVLRRWLDDRDIPATRPATAFSLLVMISSDAAALLKLSMPIT